MTPAYHKTHRPSVLRPTAADGAGVVLPFRILGLAIQNHPAVARTKFKNRFVPDPFRIPGLAI
jgi:hypothetical protein